MREPEILHRKRRELDLHEWKHRNAHEDDYQELITAPTLVFDAETNDLVLVCLQLESDTSDIEAALQQVKMEKTARTTGVRTTSRIFGSQPRSLPRRDHCTAAALAIQNPEAHRTIAKYADTVALYYEKYNPNLYANHKEKTRKVLEAWRMEDSVFTSGIINLNNPLPYHFDAGNYEHVWSNMLVFKHEVGGGYLSIPEYDLAFALPTNSLMMFDGQDVMHGVTPIELFSEEAYRYSVVFYSLKQMWSCLPINDEIARARKVRTERETRKTEAQKEEQE